MALSGGYHACLLVPRAPMGPGPLEHFQGSVPRKHGTGLRLPSTQPLWRVDLQRPTPDHAGYRAGEGPDRGERLGAAIVQHIAHGLAHQGPDEYVFVRHEPGYAYKYIRG